ncbi:MAG: hypothetical protein EXR77_19850 [Myxococcales bacterium]|nr:hypothetical protein [Myxococcales bacterium]
MSVELENFARDLSFGAQSPNWMGLLRSYRWHGADWICCVRTRLLFHARIAKLVREHGKAKTPPPEWAGLVNEIVLDWGGLRRAIGEPDLTQVWRSVLALSDDPALASVRNLYLGTSGASVSKVYHMAAPTSVAIYDSRVGRALVGLIGQAFPAPMAIPAGLQIRAPKPNATPLPALPDERFEYVNTPGQFAEGLYVASYMCRVVAAILRHEGSEQPGGVQGPDGKVGDPRWKAYHIEMALFMLGERKGETL